MLLLLTWIATGSVASDTLVLGIHPYIERGEILQRFQPLANHLGRKLGRKILVRVGQDYDTHIQAIGYNRIDIAYLGPVSYVKMLQAFGSKPVMGRLSVNGKPTFNGHIIVRSNSKICCLSALKGKRFAFGDPNSTMSSLVPRAMLIEAGVDTQQLGDFRHLRGHDNVALAVLSGDADAGAVKQEIYDKYRNRGLRSLAVTPAISEHLFVTRSNLPLATRDVIRSTLQAITEPTQVAQLLAPIKKTISAIVPADEQDYDNLRQLMAVANQQRDE